MPANPSRPRKEPAITRTSRRLHDTYLGPDDLDREEMALLRRAEIERQGSAVPAVPAACEQDPPTSGTSGDR